MPGTHTTPRAVTAAVLALAAGLAACAGPGARGRAILDGLRRDGIPMPPDAETPGATGADPDAGSRATGALPVAGTVTLGDLLRIAEVGNPGLAAARSRVGMAAAAAWQAALYPNPRLEVSLDEAPADAPGDGNSTIGIMQPIVLGGRLRAAADAGEAERAAELARYRARSRETFGEIAGVYARLVAIRAADRLYAELHETATRTLEAARARFEARAAPETEVIRPRIELHRIALARARIDRERDAAGEQLRHLLGGTGVDLGRLEEPRVEPPGPLDYAALATVVRRGHPELEAADREVEAAAARLARSRAEGTPDLELRLAGGYSAETGEPIVEAGVGITLPLGDRRRSEVLAARFDLMRAREERRAAEGALLARLAEAHAAYESARTQLGTVRDLIVPAAERAFEQTSEAYRAGRAAFLDLLEAQRTLVEARVTLVELTGEAGVARARILQIVGPEGIGAPQAPIESENAEAQRRQGAGAQP